MTYGGFSPHPSQTSMSPPEISPDCTRCLQFIHVFFLTFIPFSFFPSAFWWLISLFFMQYSWRMIQKLSNMVLPPYLFSAAILQSRLFCCPSVGVKSVGTVPHVTCNHCYMENLLYKQRCSPTLFCSTKQISLVSVCLFQVFCLRKKCHSSCLTHIGCACPFPCSPRN